jgi:signal peptidase I
MGDNRNHSSDSRDSRIGQVDVRNVVGRVLIRVYPFDKFGAVKPNAES